MCCIRLPLLSASLLLSSNTHSHADSPTSLCVFLHSRTHIEGKGERENTEEIKPSVFGHLRN